MLISQGGPFDLGAVGVGGNQGTAALLQDGNLFLVWSNTVSAFFPGPGTDVEGTALLGQILSPSGAPVGATFQINQTEPFFQNDPNVTVLNNGNVVVAWTDTPFGEAQTDARARIYTPDGIAVTDEILLATVTDGDQRIPDVAATPDGGFLAIWNDDRLETYGQYFDETGMPVGPEMIVPGGFGERFSMTVLDDGGVRYVSGEQLWIGDGGTFYNQNLDVTYLDAGSTSIFNTRFEGQYITDIETLTDDRFVIAGIRETPSGYQVSARVHDAAAFFNNVVPYSDATDVVPLSAVFTGPAQFGVYPDVTPLSDGGFVVTWAQDAEGTVPKEFEVFAVAVDSELNIQGEAVQLFTGSGNQSQPFAVESAAGEVFIGWTDTSTEVSDVPSALIGQFFTISEGGGSTAGDPIVGTEGDDVLEGTDEGEAISGQAGNDTLSGGGGDDTIAASAGNDSVNGGDGNDLIGGGTENDVITGDAGNDTIGAGLGDDTASGDDGNDIVNGGGGNDLLAGGGGNDTMGASFGADELIGGAGNDDMGGGTGKDTILAGDGDDTVGGGEGDDEIDGGTGNDFLAGGGRNDLIFGGAGDDRINGGDGDDTMTGATGADQFIFNGFNDGDADVITDFENGIDSFRMSGVENAPGSGNQGRVDALNIVDTAEGALMSYQGHTILVEGVAAADLGVEDFTFL